MGNENRNIRHIFVNESRIFVTTVAPKIIRSHIDNIQSAMYPIYGIPYNSLMETIEVLIQMQVVKEDIVMA